MRDGSMPSKGGSGTRKKSRCLILNGDMVGQELVAGPIAR